MKTKPLTLDEIFQPNSLMNGMLLKDKNKNN